eukprot:7786778-Alexandrium_andersonii.AAC.1
MSASLVGSEMCIRDSKCPAATAQGQPAQRQPPSGSCPAAAAQIAQRQSVSYTHLTLPTICSV